MSTWAKSRVSTRAPRDYAIVVSLRFGGKIRRQRHQAAQSLSQPTVYWTERLYKKDYTGALEEKFKDVLSHTKELGNDLAPKFHLVFTRLHVSMPYFIYSLSHLWICKSKKVMRIFRKLPRFQAVCGPTFLWIEVLFQLSWHGNRRNGPWRWFTLFSQGKWTELNFLV